VTGSKGGSYESPSRDRLVYLTTCLIGHQVEVQVKNGSIYSGIFHATNTEKDFGMFCYVCVIDFGDYYFYVVVYLNRLLYSVSVIFFGDNSKVDFF